MRQVGERRQDLDVTLTECSRNGEKRDEKRERK